LSNFNLSAKYAEFSLSKMIKIPSINPYIRITGVGSGGNAGDLTPQLFMWDIDTHVTLEKPNA